MADIIYFEKSQSDPHATASEENVVSVLRKAIEKRVSLRLVHFPSSSFHIGSLALSEQPCIHY